MIKSMTGFGKAEYTNEQRKIIVEIKSLNSKQVDLSVKLPNIYREKELEIRNEVTAYLQRGKIEVYVSIEEVTEETLAKFNESAIRTYYLQLSEIAKKNEIPLPPDVLNAIVRMPDVLKSNHHDPDEKEWVVLLGIVRKALGFVDDFRKKEGASLAADILGRIKLIESYVAEVESYESQRMDIVKNRLRQSLSEYTEGAIDQNRFEQELIYYLEKMDINEEKVRLRTHCAYFLETMNGEGVGKKLGFITQEIGREINTIGSKANLADMQQIVVKMKDELEKIKEQLLNIL